MALSGALRILSILPLLLGIRVLQTIRRVRANRVLGLLSPLRTRSLVLVETAVIGMDPELRLSLRLLPLSTGPQEKLLTPTSESRSVLSIHIFLYVAIFVFPA